MVNNGLMRGINGALKQFYKNDICSLLARRPCANPAGGEVAEWSKALPC